jgi:hypothetical protein
MRRDFVNGVGIFLAMLTLGCNAAPDPAPTGLSGPAVVDHSATGVTLSASASVTEATGITHWEISRDQDSATVRGYSGSGKVLADLSFNPAAGGGLAITDRTSGTSRILDAHGRTTGDALSPTAAAALAALTSDSTALKNGAPGPSTGSVQRTSQSVELECSKCYGVIEFCGHLESPDEGGPFECTMMTRCGWCIGWW